MKTKTIRILSISAISLLLCGCSQSAPASTTNIQPTSEPTTIEPTSTSEPEQEQGYYNHR